MQSPFSTEIRHPVAGSDNAGFDDADIHALACALGTPGVERVEGDQRVLPVALLPGYFPSREFLGLLMTPGQISICSPGAVDRDEYAELRRREGVSPAQADAEFDAKVGPMAEAVDQWADQLEQRLFDPALCLHGPGDELAEIEAEWRATDDGSSLFDHMVAVLGDDGALDLVERCERAFALDGSAWGDAVADDALAFRLRSGTAKFVWDTLAAELRNGAGLGDVSGKLYDAGLDRRAEDAVRAGLMKLAVVIGEQVQQVPAMPVQQVPAPTPDNGEYHPDLIAKWSVDAPDYAKMSDIATSCTGLVRDVVKYIQWGGGVESPLIALGVALPVLGNLFGRVWFSRYENKQTFSNIYTVSLARSGGGKTTTRDELISIIEEAEMVAGLVIMPDDGSEPRTNYASSVFTGGFTSDSALVRTLAERPNTLAIFDEMAYFAEQAFDQRANQYAKNLSKVLLDAMTATPGKIAATTRSSKELTGSSALNPCLCVAGMSTPRMFWKSFPRSAFENGLVGRIGFFLDDRPPTPERYKPAARPEQIEDLRRSIVARFAAVMRWRAEHLPALGFGNTEPAEVKINGSFVEVPYTEEALAVREQIADHCHRMNYEAEVADRIDADLWKRACEMIQRVALIHALGRDHTRPVVTVADLNFAGLLVIGNAGRLTRRMMADEGAAIDEKAAKVRQILADRAEQAWSKGETIQHAKLVRRIGADRSLVERTIAALLDEGFMIIKAGLRGVSYARGAG